MKNEIENNEKKANDEKKANEKWEKNEGLPLNFLKRPLVFA